MANATFEDHPTDPNKVILRKNPRLDLGPDYERGFVDGLQHQMQSSVEKAVNRMARQWVGLKANEVAALYNEHAKYQEESPRASGWYSFADAIEAILKERNA